MSYAFLSSDERLRDLTITVSPTLYGIDDVTNMCAAYPEPPTSPSENPVVVNCTRGMLGRYVKIAKHRKEVLHLCEVELA